MKLPEWMSRVRKELINFYLKIYTGFLDGIWWPPIALTAVALIWFSVARDLPKPEENTVEKLGSYGDSFGQLTSLFTALGFGGLIITLMLQQRQIRNQEKENERNLRKQERVSHEELLFRLLDIYRQTLSEVRNGDLIGRDVIIKSLERVDHCIIEEKVNDLPKDIKGRWDKQELTEQDNLVIDYLQYRNFKIVSTEIQAQNRLIDTFEALLRHVVEETPNHLLNTSYKKLVYAQITQYESRYYFLVALAHPAREQLRDLLDKSGLINHFSRAQVYALHRQMYEEYWGYKINDRDTPPSVPMSKRRIKKAASAYKEIGGDPKLTYVALGVRSSQKKINSHSIKNKAADD